MHRVRCDGDEVVVRNQVGHSHLEVHLVVAAVCLGCIRPRWLVCDRNLGDGEQGRAQLQRLARVRRILDAQRHHHRDQCHAARNAVEVNVQRAQAVVHVQRAASSSLAAELGRAPARVVQHQLRRPIRHWPWRRLAVLVALDVEAGRLVRRLEPRRRLWQVLVARLPIDEDPLQATVSGVLGPHAEALQELHILAELEEVVLVVVERVRDGDLEGHRGLVRAPEHDRQLLRLLVHHVVHRHHGPERERVALAARPASGTHSHRRQHPVRELARLHVEVERVHHGGRGEGDVARHPRGGRLPVGDHRQRGAGRNVAQRVVPHGHHEARPEAGELGPREDGLQIRRQLQQHRDQDVAIARAVVVHVEVGGAVRLQRSVRVAGARGCHGARAGGGGDGDLRLAVRDAARASGQVELGHRVREAVARGWEGEVGRLVLAGAPRGHHEAVAHHVVQVGVGADEEALQILAVLEPREGDGAEWRHLHSHSHSGRPIVVTTVVRHRQ
mmetsp:Transcript_21115/g.68099  ORF Transcript_21115/g.68099 Transcript_21115/m.68099 type:complete len:500 (+) Transcript_21115:1469-2968(+)